MIHRAASDHVTVLAGGSGAAKLILGLVQVAPEERIRVVCNVGDDCEMWGLYICPDIDRVLHTLAGESDPYRDAADPESETYQCLERIRKLGMPSWLRITDRDMATHLVRSDLLRQGRPLDEVTSHLAHLFGLGTVILPVTNDPVRTRIRFGNEVLGWHEYRSRNGDGQAPLTISYDHAAGASAAPGVIQSIRDAHQVILAPGDPLGQVDPILAVPGIREALTETRATVVGISPVVGSIPAGAARKPTAVRTAAMSARWVAERYRDILDHIVIHTSDLAELDAIQSIGVQVLAENILLETSEDADRLAAKLLNPDRFEPAKLRR